MSEGYAQFFGGAVCCGTCRFYEAAELDCRRFPPQVVPTDEYPGTRFPAVLPKWWCGEYQPPVQEKTT